MAGHVEIQSDRYSLTDMWRVLGVTCEEMSCWSLQAARISDIIHRNIWWAVLSWRDQGPTSIKIFLQLRSTSWRWDNTDYWRNTCFVWDSPPEFQSELTIKKMSVKSSLMAPNLQNANRETSPTSPSDQTLFTLENKNFYQTLQHSWNRSTNDLIEYRNLHFMIVCPYNLI